jgi:hypothetical protein
MHQVSQRKKKEENKNLAQGTQRHREDRTKQAKTSHKGTKAQSFTKKKREERIYRTKITKAQREK